MGNTVDHAMTLGPGHAQTCAVLQNLEVELEKSLREDLVVPVEIEPLGTVTRLEIMRGTNVFIPSDRRPVLSLGRTGPQYFDLIIGRLRLDRPLRGYDWAVAWWWMIRPDLPSQVRDAGDKLDITRLAALINRLARRTGLIPEASRQVLSCVPLDPEMQALAQHLTAEHALHSDQLSYVSRNRRAARQRFQEAPKLWPLYDLLRPHGVTPGRSLGEVKRELRAGKVSGGRKLTKGGWRVLCRYGRAVWWPLRYCHEYRRDRLRELVWHANLLAATGFTGLPHPALTLALGRASSMRAICGSVSSLTRVVPLVQAAWIHLEELDPKRRRRLILSGVLDEVLSWWLTLADPKRRPPSADWSWFVTQMRRTSQTDRIDDAPWLHIGRVQKYDDAQVIPLCTLKDVRKAGRALRNCMAQADSSDEESTVPHYLICDSNGNATAMFSATIRLHEPVQVTQILTRFNQPASECLTRIAQSYLEQEQRHLRILAVK